MNNSFIPMCISFYIRRLLHNCDSTQKNQATFINLRQVGSQVGIIKVFHVSHRPFRWIVKVQLLFLRLNNFVNHDAGRSFLGDLSPGISRLHKLFCWSKYKYIYICIGSKCAFIHCILHVYYIAYACCFTILLSHTLKLF